MLRPLLTAFLSSLRTWGGVPEVVVTGEGGFCLAKEDVSGYAAAILRLLQYPVLRQAQGELGFRRYQALFSSKVMAQRYANLVHRSEEFCRGYV